MDRKQAQTIISETLDQDICSVSTDQLVTLRQDIMLQMKSAEDTELYSNLIDALNTEIGCRREDEFGKQKAGKIESQAPEKVRTTADAGAQPGELRRGVSRSGSTRWRVTGR